MSNRIATLISLHPKFRAAATDLNDALALGYKTGKTQFRFQPFETIRSPDRQEEVFGKGMSKARAWQSAHQFGLACDFVPFLGNNAECRAAATLMKRATVLPGWFWPNADHPDWDFLTQEARHRDLITISWDRPHVQSPLFDKVKAILA